MDYSQLDPEHEARRIVSSYLNARGWAKQWQQNIPITYNRKKWNSDIYSQRYNRVDSISDEAEEKFYADIDYWRGIETPKARAVLNEVIRLIGQRKDLDFFAQKMVNRIKQERGW